ncbi:MAG: diacylglycerol kinase [Proteobacteria bacterium]|nr:diacylglycerol kinase [Pseudomonadota bacterium]
MSSQGTTGLERLFKAFGFSMQGLSAAFKNEAAFRQEIYLSIILIPMGFYLGKTGIEKTLLVSVILLVLIIELINSGMEAIVDRFGDEQHELSGRAKDVASAAVLIALVNVLLVWGCVLIL